MTTDTHVPTARRAPRVTAVCLAGLVLLLVASSIPLAVVTGGLKGSQILTGSALILMLVTIAAVGLVVAWHQPGNPIGWLLISISVCFLSSLESGTYAILAYHLGHAGVPFKSESFLLGGLWSVAVLLFATVILLFPEGHLPSRRWKWFLGACLAAGGSAAAIVEAVTISVISRPHFKVLSDGQLAAIQHPAGGASVLLMTAQLTYFASLAVLWLGSIARQIQSWRRSSGERRQQLKWLVSGAVIFAALGVPSEAITSSLWEVAALGFAALPVAIGIGILKYRLYEIDRIISRTLSYAIVTGLLVGVYAGLVLLATRVLSLHSQIAVAVSTLAAVALFTPLRRRVQRAVDRRFNRARYDADRTVAAFAGRLQDAVDLDTVRADLLATVRGALEPAHATVWITRGGPG